MDWEECCKKRFVKDISKDSEFVNSLIKTSENKLKSEGKLIIDETTASSKISLAYDSLRELLEALSIKNGYKIYNHECYTAYLKEILNKGDFGEEFDELRKIRNSINYYGKEISIEDAKDTLERIKNLRKLILEILNQE